MTSRDKRGIGSAPAGAGVEQALPRARREGSSVELRLAISKDGLGIELARPVTIACLDVVELVVGLPHVRFPFDVTGGVAKFRHKRGELDRVALEIDAQRAARWAEPRLRGLLSAGSPEVAIEPRAFGATITIASQDAAHLRALAFDVGVVPAEADLAIVTFGARGAGLAAPATLLALRAVSALLGDAAVREGSRFFVPRAAERLARRLLPDAGMRAPEGADVVLTGSGASDGVLFAAFRAAGALASIPDETTRANEAALLSRTADDARANGNLERARQLDVAALERAPNHPEVARRIAEIDAQAGGRAEAAIATLRAADRSCEARGGLSADSHPPFGQSAALRADLSRVRIGTLLGDLLVEAGEPRAAVAALLHEAEREPSPALAGLVFARAAALASDPHDALVWLDAAIARAPRLAALRWERARRRLTAGRLADARADFQELEALATGARDRYEVLRRGADVYRAAGLGADAAIFYERALLYRPDDPSAIAGLGAAIAAEGRAARGAALLAHAIEATEKRAREDGADRSTSDASAAPATAWMELALARILGDRLDDRPAAIARLRAIPDDSGEAIEARGLEGRYRAALGDAAGAALAFARLREHAASMRSAEPTGAEARAAVPWLLEAAGFDEERGDLHAAQQDLAAAIALAPADAAILERYRAVGARIAERAGLVAFEPSPPFAAAPPELSPLDLDEHPTVALDEYPTVALDEDPTFTDDGDPAALAEAEARVESLTRALQGRPDDDAVVDELVSLLTRLGRSMELLALLSARLEDAPPERRGELLPKHREVLAQLEEQARAKGRDGEADLFKMAREAS